MSTEIKYTDTYNKILTAQQLLQTDNFTKHIYVDSVLKSEEQNYTLPRTDKKFKRIFYFLDDTTENRDTVANQLCNIQENTSCVIRYNKQTLNEFTLWDSQFYDVDGLPKGNGGQVVYNDMGRNIYSSVFDQETVPLRSVTKIMYANETDNDWEDRLFLFHFIRDIDTGEMELSIHDANNRYYWLMPQDIDVEFVQGEGYWDNHQNYHSHLPILPDTENI
jgi:hypothetical protein